MPKLVNIGYNNMIAVSKIVAIVGRNSHPIKRLIGEARSIGKLIDATCGRKTRTVIITDNGHIILSALSPQTAASKLSTGEHHEP